MAAMVELADFQKMEQVRARVDSIVKDPSTAAALKPYYRQFCKRPCFHDEYLQTFNRPNVKLIDTQGRGVDRITENAVVVDGKAYEVDCIIYATGFEVGTSYTRRAGYESIGRDGADADAEVGQTDLQRCTVSRRAVSRTVFSWASRKSASPRTSRTC